MRIFVTGGTGFIGSHFLQAALAAGHEVRALRRPGSEPRIALSLQPVWVEGDLQHCPAEAFAGCDALVHLAAVGVSPQKASVGELFAQNVQGSLSLWNRAVDAGVKHLVICGSCFEYGRSAGKYDRIPADAPLEPVNPYGESKAAASLAAIALAQEKRCRITILRPFTVYGDGQHQENFYPSLRGAALAGSDFIMTLGEQVRDFVPVGQVAGAFLAALTRAPEPGHPAIFNVGTGQAQTLRAFAEHWWHHWQAPGRLLFGAVPYRANEVMRYVPEI